MIEQISTANEIDCFVQKGTLATNVSFLFSRKGFRYEEKSKR